jgi:hypothetical protein
MRAAVALTSLAAVAVTAAATSVGNTCVYCSSGPCVPTVNIDSPFEAEDSTGKKSKLSVKLTVPGTAASVKPPYPVIFFFNGFQVRKC